MNNFDTVREALDALIKRDQINTCQHDNTHRGGSIWEICDDCGMKWADDRGGKPKWEDPPEWEAADKALAALAEIERTHYTAEDVADASAQGFRDGVASVTAGQEPVGEVVCIDPGDDEDGPHAIVALQVDVQLGTIFYAAPVAQQPQAEPITEAVIDAYLEDYEMRGEDEDGRDTCYAPSDDEKALIKDAIMGLLAELPVKQPQAEAVPELTDSQIMASVGRNAGGPDTSISESRPLGQQWTEICALVRHIIRERYCGVAPQQAEAVPSDVTDAMVDAYLNTNDAYWRETDAQPKSSARWRNGNVKEATRVSLAAALAAAPKGQP